MVREGSKAWGWVCLEALGSFFSLLLLAIFRKWDRIVLNWEQGLIYPACPLSFLALISWTLSILAALMKILGILRLARLSLLNWLSKVLPLISHIIVGCAHILILIAEHIWWVNPETLADSRRLPAICGLIQVAVSRSTRLAAWEVVPVLVIALDGISPDPSEQVRSRLVENRVTLVNLVVRIGAIHHCREAGLELGC